MTKGNYRLLLTREYQKNLKDSAKKLIEDTVKRLNMVSRSLEDLTVDDESDVKVMIKNLKSSSGKLNTILNEIDNMMEK